MPIALERPPSLEERADRAPGPARRGLRVAILADMLEEKWPSMDLVADCLLRELSAQADLGIEPELVRPRLVRVTRPWQSDDSPIPTRDRVLNRFWLYRRSLRRARDADVFHVVDHSYAHLATHLPRGRVVITCHDTDAFADLREGQASGLPAFLRRRLLRGLAQAAMVTCPSRSTADALEHAGLVPGSRLAVVHNGVDVHLLAPDRARQLTRDLLGDEKHGCDLLHVGSTIPRKRIDVLLEVFARVFARSRSTRLIRVGGPFTPAQEALARELGVHDRVVVLPSLDRETLAAVYTRAALLLATSEREGFGLPVAEALAAGCPVVATDLPVFREVAGPAATYVPLDRLDRWADAVVSHLRERQECPEKWALRRQEARRQGSVFSWARHAREMADVYRRVLPGVTATS